MSSHKTIAKNTLFLYFRMFLTMGVGLYTSRMVLDVLGVEDYGIYGLVGGIVTMFAFLNSAMASATQRYLSFDIGKGDKVRLQQTFNASVNIHFLIGIVIVILAETVGLWFVNTQLDIPAERMVAANWVYQFSILAFFFNVIQVPYNALLIAREHMSVYAYISIIDVLLKLGIVFILIYYNADKLILYGILTFAVSFIVRMLYRAYCKRKFKESVYKFYYDKTYYKELLSFSGWSLFGNIAAIARGQGSNILLNIFFGPIANAAYSLTSTVQGVIGQFVNNFQVALNPQITKNYASGNTNASISLMQKSSKFSYFAMLILVVPFLYNIDYVMNLWLKEVPPYAISFIRLALIYALIETISNPLIIGAQATGKIKWYQIIIGTFIFLTLPAAWVVFKLTNNPLNLYWVLIVNSAIALLFRLVFLRKMMQLGLRDYFNKVFIRIFIVSATAVAFTYILPLTKAINFMELIYQSIIIVSFILIVVYYIGLNNNERTFINNFVKSKIKTK